LEYLFQTYKAEAHPRVTAMQKSGQQVRLEFQNAIAKKSSDGTHITEAEFLAYYIDVNATLPPEKEQYFSDVIIGTWGITSAPDYVSPNRLIQLEQIIYEKMRQKTKIEDDEGKTAKKIFQHFDKFSTGVIDVNQFAASLNMIGCSFTKKEIQSLFNKHGNVRSGKM